MRIIGSEVGFAFALHRVTSRLPIELRSGRGIIIATDDYSVPCAPGYRLRVTESPDYATGEILHLSTMSVRP